jgi:hypothetical protein
VPGLPRKHRCTFAGKGPVRLGHQRRRVELVQRQQHGCRLGGREERAWQQQHGCTISSTQDVCLCACSFGCMGKNLNPKSKPENLHLSQQHARVVGMLPCQGGPVVPLKGPCFGHPPLSVLCAAQVMTCAVPALITVEPALGGSTRPTGRSTGTVPRAHQRCLTGLERCRGSEHAL